MGVPAFFRWLVNKYPKVVVNATEERGEDSDPHGMKFDNFYLDMNGIIHPCFHPEDQEDHTSPPTTFQEVFENIHEYIDCLFAIVRPQKLLYMAIDGVAPRAKMNQQRSRRFRTSKDNEIKDAEETRLRRQYELEGKQLFPKQESEVSDSNVITPGTVFMQELSKSLQSYIDQRLINDAGWKDLKVILSDANVPGEGEHKIMSFIRLQRASPGYDPNSSHCLYGLDADLIMLALATHEVHFSILREDILGQKPQQPDYRGSSKQARSVGGNKEFVKKPYQFLHLWILREYLELDIKIVDPPENVKLDLERIIDDFIFICFFMGNDFLPHMPTLEIHEGGIDLLMHVYREEFKNLGGYLVDMQRAGDKKQCYVKLKRVEKFILSVGTFEERIFKKRTVIRERRLRRIMAECTNDAEEEQEEETGPDVKLCASASGKVQTSQSFEATAIENSESPNACKISEALQNMKDLNQKVKSCIRDRSDLFKNGSFALDKVKLGTAGWRERYYKEKFAAETKEDMERTRKEVVQKYTEGLCWVLQYYFCGVPSWTWFYPFHYGPFTSDFKGLSQVKVNLQKGSPFKPFDQLMAVLPPRSAHALPRAYEALMKSEDLIYFYPYDFDVDEEGKRFTWQAICKLPFIDEDRLLCHTKKLEVELQDNEVERNSTKGNILYMRTNQELRSQRLSSYKKQHEGKPAEMVKQTIDTDSSIGISGFFSPLKECQENDILCMSYELPNSSQHVPRPLEGVRFPEKMIRENDIVEMQLWHEFHGNWPSRTRSQSQYPHRNATDGENPSSRKSFHGELHKGSCFVWGRGRGMPENNGEISNSKSYLGEVHKGAGSGWGRGRGMPENNGEISSSKSYLGEVHKGAGSGRGRGRGTLENNFSDSHAHTERSRNFQSGRSGNEAIGQSSSWDSRAHNAYKGTHNTIEKWTAPTFGRGIGDLRISDSQQGYKCRGRAQPGSNTHSSTHCNNFVDNRNLSWRPNLHPSAAAVSGQHRERWSQVTSGSTTTNAWQHYPPSAASPSTPGRGRGKYVPKAAPMDWKLRDTTGTSPTENLAHK